MAFVPDEAIARCGEISAGAFRLYVYFCKKRNHKSGDCWPSLRCAAREMGGHFANLGKWRQELLDCGWICLKVQPGGVPFTIPLCGFDVGGGVVENTTPRVVKKEGGGVVEKRGGVSWKTLHPYKEEPAHEEPAQEVSSSESSSSARAVEKLTTHFRKIAASLPEPKPDPKPKPKPKPKPLPCSSPPVAQVPSHSIREHPRYGRIEPKPPQVPAPLTESELERVLISLEKAHPGVNVRHVRDKLARAGGEQTVFRLSRWCAMEHRSAALPTLKLESEDERLDRLARVAYARATAN